MLSLVVIAKNEADRIERCLRSVPFADETLVLDSGSEDGTPELALRCGAKVVRTDWPGYVEQKNRGLDQAEGDWVLSLDADEALSPRAQREVQAAMAGGEADAFSFPRCSSWLGHEIRHGRWYPDRKVRLVKKGTARWGGDNPHDRLVPHRPATPLLGDILHWPYRSFDEHVATIGRFSAVQSRALYDRGERARWHHVALRPPLHFLDAYLLRRGFRDGVPGLVLAGLGAANVLCKYSRLWLMEREESP